MFSFTERRLARVALRSGFDRYALESAASSDCAEADDRASGETANINPKAKADARRMKTPRETRAGSQNPAGSMAVKKQIQTLNLPIVSVLAYKLPL
jgi:hypothetical protein